MTVEPKIETNPSQLVLGVKKRGPYSLIPNMLMESYTYLQQKGAHPTGAPISLYSDFAQADDPNADHNLEVVWPIAAPVSESDTMKCYELPAAEMVTVVYKGPYDQIGATYGELMQWTQEHGKHISGPLRESYLNDPNEVGMENALTKIMIPV